MDVKNLKIEAEKELFEAKDLKELDAVSKKYLGKNGELTRILRSLASMPKAKRVEVGRAANELKRFLEEEIKQKQSAFAPLSGATADKAEWLDVSAPGKRPLSGHLHPLTLVKREIENIFQSMGFEIVEGPDTESEWYNFDALNIPKDHPARDAWDTFYLKNGQLLRTHTTPVDVRYMEKNNPPLRIIIPGNIFRHEATDASHELQAYQFDGLMVGKDISAANFKAVATEFFRRFFKEQIKMRLRPDFFPFTEPSFDVSISCLLCQGKGCPVCKHGGWLEIGGAGMIHPNVLKNSKLIPKEWQGWAFGFGVDRLAMMKYKIDEIRLFRSGDLRFLNQF